MRFIIIRAAALGLLLAAAASAQEWIEYSNRSDFFAINFPGEPKAKDITYVTEYSITLPAHVYSYENGRSRYSVTVVDYTNEDGDGIARAAVLDRKSTRLNSSH